MLQGGGDRRPSLLLAAEGPSAGGPVSGDSGPDGAALPATRFEGPPGLAQPSVAPSREPGLRAGTVVAGRYRIVGFLGRGGMGEVYHATDTKLGGEVALKLLSTDLRGPLGLRRFLSEVRISRKISHRNVCRVHDVGEYGNRHFLSMELVEGEDLGRLLGREGALASDRAARIGAELCDGLGAVHEQGVLHRDLKPSNVLIDGGDHPRLSDFGLASVVDSEVLGGTPAYMPPEVFEDLVASVQSELYALGLILYELFTGRHPFEGTKAADLRRRHREDPPPPPSSLRPEIPPTIEQTILRCLEKDPRSRPLSAAAVAQALRGGKVPAESGWAIRLREWRPPPLPDHPYPVLLPYQHPELLAGRDQEIDLLRRRVELPLPIQAVSAPSGTGKSSLLAGGLLPALRAAGRPAVLDRHPTEPGIAGRLISGLLATEGGVAMADGDGVAFVDRLGEVEELAGMPPVLILDQVEELFTLPGARRARAALGILLAATCRRRPGHAAPPCRWLLAYREEAHGWVTTWLGDVLADAEREGFGVDLDLLPRDLGRHDRFQVHPLQPLATPLGGSTHQLADAAEAFARVIRAPLEVLVDGRPYYPLRFADGAVERLAKALAEARLERPEASLAPELQVILAYQLERAPEVDGVRVVEIPEAVGEMIERALEEHLERALEAAFPAGRGAAQGRARALLALRELASAAGHRQGRLPAETLEAAIGVGGEGVLETLAGPAARLVVPRMGPEGLTYELSHDRLAEILLRMADREGRSGGLIIDSELLALRRQVGLQTALHRAGEGSATRLRGPTYRRIARHSEALLWDEDRRDWWAACRRQRRSTFLRRLSWSFLLMIGLGLAAFLVHRVAEHRAQRIHLLEQIGQGDPTVATAALAQALSRFDVTALQAALRTRERPLDLLESGLGGIESAKRSEVGLRIAELSLDLVDDDTDDRTVRRASLLWALDYLSIGSPEWEARASDLRERVMAPVWTEVPPPDPESEDWVDLPGGTFWMGAGPEDGREGEQTEDEFPRHQVQISAFRLLEHEVTEEEFARLFPGNVRNPDMPASGLTWYEATVYAAWIGGRLPTEAELEYAARSDCEFTYCGADGSSVELDQVAWWIANSLNERGEHTTHEVGSLEANQHGFHDLYGNVWEWVSDWYGYYPDHLDIDPVGPPASEDVPYRLFRGGSFLMPIEWIYPTARGGVFPDRRSRELGLRPVGPPVGRRPQRSGG